MNCKSCGTKWEYKKDMIDYSEAWDAYFCLNCKEWVESKCGDKDCAFCSNRPEKAS